MGRDPTSRTILALLGIALVLWFLYQVRDVLTPFLIAFILATLMDPVLDRLQRRGIPRALAVALTFGTFLAVFVGGTILIAPLAISEGQQLATQLTPQKLDAYLSNVRQTVDAFANQHLGLLERFHLPSTVTQALDEYQTEISSYLQALVGYVFDAFSASMRRLIWLVIIPIVTLYVLVDIDRIRARAYYLIPEAHRETALSIATSVVAVFASYLRGLLLVCVGNGLTVGVLLGLFFRLPYSLILAVVAGVLYAVPYIGPVASIATAALVAWTTGHSLAYTMSVAATVLFVNIAFDYGITPRVLGRRTGLHPVVSIFALMVGGTLFGLMGMILAVPVAASGRVVLEHFYPRLAEPLPEEAAVVAQVDPPRPVPEKPPSASETAAGRPR
jgi:predicted PurR-regulated permease PerM